MRLWPVGRSLLRRRGVTLQKSTLPRLMATLRGGDGGAQRRPTGNGP